MPLNILRLNQRHAHPTPHIVFIKALSGPDSKQAEAYLSRVAAICHPILANNHISVTTLEEYEPNREFIGRNFNAGECIQLVLRTRSGGWLPFKSVVMVAMHELAHCKQMNHSRAFWATRNQYATEMRDLWSKGYTGEGVWGRGRELERGEFEIQEGEWGGEGMPERLCGGTFRSRGRGKRKRTQLSYAEREKKRIERKFGVNGEKLGEDQAVKFFLDGGKNVAGKPRVASSTRGRELRAQAALVRLGAAKVDSVKKEEEIKTEVKAEDEWEEYEDEDSGKADAVDLNGSKMKDSQGHVMVKVCEDEDQDDVYVKRERDELNDLWSIPEALPEKQDSGPSSTIRTLGRPGEHVYGKTITKQAGSSGNSKNKSSTTGNDDMRAKLDSFHNSGSIIKAFGRQEKKSKKK